MQLKRTLDEFSTRKKPRLICAYLHTGLAYTSKGCGVDRTVRQFLARGNLPLVSILEHAPDRAWQVKCMVCILSFYISNHLKSQVLLHVACAESTCVFWLAIESARTCVYVHQSSIRLLVSNTSGLEIRPLDGFRPYEKVETDMCPCIRSRPGRFV